MYRRQAIDTALAERPADLDEFLNLMKRAGYEAVSYTHLDVYKRQLENAAKKRVRSQCFNAEREGFSGKPGNREHF